jgi:hypothetical protein
VVIVTGSVPPEKLFEKLEGEFQDQVDDVRE